jgi:hypothetical protein
MAMKKIVRKYDNSAEFIVGDHYVNIKKLHPKAVSGSTGNATLVGDRYIVTAGTLITDGGVPLGLCYRDMDVTDGDAMIPVCVHAVVRRDALPAALTHAQEAALTGICFVDGDAPEAVPSEQPEYYIIDMSGEHVTFKPEAGSSRITPGGGSFAFKLEVASGYHVTGVTANGEAITAGTGGVYAVEDIDEDQAIVAATAAD